MNAADPEHGTPVIGCDLDGVIWRGDDAILGAAAGIAALRAAGFRVAFLSNNSSHVVADVVAKLDRFGIMTDPADVFTSARAAADLLAGELAPGSRVLVCAGPGVAEALTGVGFEPVRDRPAAAVVVGFHQDFDFAGLTRATDAVRDGARFVATNRDATYPIPGGMAPGAGAIVAAVATASGREPEVAGKPSAPTVAMVQRELGTRGVIIGDRPSTDGALADALGWPFALVLSGVTAAIPPLGGEAIPDPPPAYVADDLGVLAPRLVAAFAPRGA
jgi:HAD superfamily hydrolase (TIGR01450 family)